MRAWKDRRRDFPPPRSPYPHPPTFNPWMNPYRPSDIEKLEQAPADAIVEHFSRIPDITEYTLDSHLYPLAKLENLKKILEQALSTCSPQSDSYLAYDKILRRLSDLMTTRIDYVQGFIEQILSKKSILTHRYPLEVAPTSEILFHVDLMKDVGIPAAVGEDAYNEALQKLVKALKFRFNEALNVYKELYLVTHEEIAKDQNRFPQEDLEQYKNFLEDALLMTKKHITVKTQQVNQLKGTLLKILEALALRALESKDLADKAQYKHLLHLIEVNLDGFEAEFAREIVERFSNARSEMTMEKYSLATLRHHRKLIELIMEASKYPEQVLDLYDILVDLVLAESEQVRSFKADKRDLEIPSLEVKVIKGEEELDEEMTRFEALTLAQKALALIHLSLYGLFEHISSRLTAEEFSKYPIGIIKSTEKTLKDLEQHGLPEKDIKAIQNNADYLKALERIDKTLATYKSSGDKYDFIKIYKETDYEIDGLVFCAFNDLILRMIQNIGEASFILDSTETGISQDRRQELTVTIGERYRQEWERQAQERQKEEELELVKLAESL